MKKILSVVLVAVMAMSLLAGCTGFATSADAPAPVPTPDDLAKQEKYDESSPKRKMLIVIDMQVDFVDGALGSAEAVEFVPNVIEKIKSYPAEDVYATMDTHFEDNYMDTWEGKNLPVLHCIKDTPGWELYPGIKELIPEDHIFVKYTFGSLDLQEFIKQTAAEQDIELEFVGLCTDICVVSNAMLAKATVPSMQITVDASCCAGVSVPTHEAALDTMATCQMIVTNR